MNFFLPDFSKALRINIFIIDLLKEHPEYFYEDIEIKSIYGAFPGSIWNGGRVQLGYSQKEEMIQAVQTLNNKGVSVRYTFTNCLLEEKHLFDTYCNLAMDVANNGMNEVLVNSPLLENYLRDKYPNFKYILSTTRCERDLNTINELTKQYDLVVTDYRDNSNFEFLEGIKDKEKIELLVNAYCNPECKIRQQHYESISRHQLNFEGVNPFIDKVFVSCPTYKMNFYDILNYDSVIKKESLQNYIDMGFSNFKIEGRTMPPIQVVESYLYYLIKPEYKDKVRLMILNQPI